LGRRVELELKCQVYLKNSFPSVTWEEEEIIFSIFLNMKVK
jgi:hypothetical protein